MFCIFCFLLKYKFIYGFPNGSVGKESTCNVGDTGDAVLIPRSGRSPGGGKWQRIPVFLPGKSHGQRSLAGYSPWGLKSWTRLSNCTYNTKCEDVENLDYFYTTVGVVKWYTLIGIGNGNPLQCSLLENPRDGGAWWAAVYGIAQSWTRMKRLSVL